MELTYDPSSGPFPLQPGDVLISWFDNSTHEDLLVELFTPSGPVVVIGMSPVHEMSDSISINLMRSDGSLTDCDAFPGDSFLVARQPPG